MEKDKMLGIGLAGLGIAAICYFTPMLILFLRVFGLGSLVAWLNLLLVPAMVLFAAMTLLSAWKYLCQTTR